MNNLNMRSLIVSILLALAGNAYAMEEGIVKNADGDYVITFRSGSGHMIQWLWEPTTKIDPSVTWRIKQSEKTGSLGYRYKFVNGRSSKQNLDGGNLTASSVVPKSQITPSGWHGSVAEDWGRSSGIIVGWSFHRGIKPGSHQDGFGFESNDLPGVSVVRFYGFVPEPSMRQIFPSDNPFAEDISESNPIRDQFNNLHANAFVPRNTAIPKIPVSIPFDAGATLDALRAHITKDIVDLKLIDPTLASQLDRLIQAAANSVRLNNLEAARDQIQDARVLLHKEHEDIDKDQTDKEDADRDDKDRDDKHKTTPPLIDKLAARVIDFDLRYVAKRLKGKDDKDKD